MILLLTDNGQMDGHTEHSTNHNLFWVVQFCFVTDVHVIDFLTKCLHL